MNLNLTIDDPEVLRYLNRDGDAKRTPRATVALRIGVLALSNAEGVVDAEAIKREGAQIVSGIKSMLDAHAAEVSQKVGADLGRYLDPKTGAFQQGIERLVTREAQVVKEMEGAVLAHVGDTGTVARTIAKAVGEGSPLFRLLDPAQRDGLLSKMADLLGKALEAQHAAVTGEFSLDRADSALSRLVKEIAGRNEKLTQDLDLGREDSALSRLVGRVEQAQRLTVEQFSLDNEGSGLSRMLGTLEGKIASLGVGQQEFHTRVLEMLSRYDEREKVQATGTQHGQVFEDALLEKLGAMAGSAGDLFDATGTTTGIIRNCKVGDAVITIGPERLGAGRRIVYEAKEDVSYGDAKALAEIEIGMKNRGADVGVFVFSRKTAPRGMQPLRRVGSAILLVWDQEDSGVFLDAAHAVATAMLARAASAKDTVDFDFDKIDTELAEIEKMVERVGAIREKCETIRRAAAAIEDEARITSEKVGGSAKKLRAQVTSLKTGLE